MSNRAVLLVNLGSPDKPDVKSVRTYLNQFLMDPFVIQLPWLLRKLIVGLLVLPLRPKSSAAAYRRVWMEEGSPLLVLSRRLLASLRKVTGVPVDLAMRYGNPAIEAVLLELAAKPGVEEILLIPLYPHYAESTVRTSVAEAQRVIARHGLKVSLQTRPPFFDDAGYIAALAASVRPWLDDESAYDHVIFSYHGLPESHITSADPTGEHCLKHPDCCQTPSPAHATCYRHQVLRTTECLAGNIGLHPDRYSVTFQSRLGRAKWLEPSTEGMLLTLASQGVGRVRVLCPAFVTDCLETLEEIEIQGREVFIEAGGQSLELIPCLNDHPAWVQVLSEWCEQPR